MGIIKTQKICIDLRIYLFLSDILIKSIKSIFYFKIGCSPKDIFTPLSPAAACRFSEECMNLECCLDVPDINRRFKIQFIFDPCNYKYTIKFEKFTFENNLFDVDLTTEQTISLRGVLTAR